MITLASIDEGKATTVLYKMFDRHTGHGSAGRLLAYFMGHHESTTEELIASLPGIGNFLAVLTSARERREVRLSHQTAPPPADAQP